METLLSLGVLTVVLSVAALALSWAATQWRLARVAAEVGELEAGVLRERIRQIREQRLFEREKNELSWNGFRKFKLAARVPEADGVASFRLVPHDGRPLPPYLPGQYLTFRLAIPGQPKPVIRCYSLSQGPGRTDAYRVTVKATGGLASGYLHESAREGDILDLKAPAGNFTLEPGGRRPIVLIGSGIGVTPVLSMLEAAVAEGDGPEVWFFYGARSSKEAPLRQEIAAIAERCPRARLHVCFSRPGPEDRAGTDYAHLGRVDVALLREVLPTPDCGFYLCGPAAMMDQLSGELAGWGVPEDQIFYESFGSATVKKVSKAAPADEPAAEAEVFFARSVRRGVWRGGGASLLDVAESCGVTIESGCRAGNCGTCLTAVKAGAVDYLAEPGSPPEAGSCLACIAIPKGGPVTLDA